jgi:hypothetical protein
LLIGGLFLASYTAGIALLVGILLALWLRFIFLLDVLRLGRWLRIILLFVTLVLLGFFCLRSIPLLLNFPIPRTEPPEAQGGDRYTIKEYQATIKQLPSTNDFVITETGMVSSRSTDQRLRFSLPERTVSSTGRGFLVREVNVTPFDNATADFVLLPLSDGTTALAECCLEAKAAVELLDFPTGSFHAAKDTDVEKLPYVGTETITWNVPNLARGITFAYIPSPFHYLRFLLAPFYGLASLGDWVWAIIGVVGATIIMPVVESSLSDYIKEKVKAWLKRDGQKKPAEQKPDRSSK